MVPKLDLIGLVVREMKTSLAFLCESVFATCPE